MTNTLVTKKAMCVTDEIKSANELNDFYRRFETRDYTQVNAVRCLAPWLGDEDRIQPSETEVGSVFRRSNSNPQTLKTRVRSRPLEGQSEGQSFYPCKSGRTFHRRFLLVLLAPWGGWARLAFDANGGHTRYWLWILFFGLYRTDTVTHLTKHLTLFFSDGFCSKMNSLDHDHIKLLLFSLNTICHYIICLVSYIFCWV